MRGGWSQPLGPRRGSKTGKLGELLLSAVHVHGPKLGAAMQSGYGFARVQQPMRVERALDGEKAAELTGAELQAHLVDLLDPHAVLAGDGAAGADAEFQNARAE